MKLKEPHTKLKSKEMECIVDPKVIELQAVNEQLLQRIDKLERDEKDLRMSYSELKQLLDAIPSILIGVAYDDRVTRWNDVAETTFGITANNVIGRTFRECGIQWDWEKVDKYVSKSQKMNCTTRLDDIPYMRPDGSQGFLGFNVNPISNNMIEKSCVLLIGKDITKRKNMENQLIQAQRLEVIGQLAAGITHEINTPMQYIVDNTCFIQVAFDDICKLLKKYSHFFEMNKSCSVMPEVVDAVEVMIKEADVGYLVKEIPNAIEQSQEGINRVIEIVSAMKTFSHPDNRTKKLVDINKAIKGTITVSRNEWKYVANMETELDPDLPQVLCYPGEINQVILNLIVNAAHAIGEVLANGGMNKGIIRISTHHDGEWVKICISDTGIGIPENVRGRIFDLFFTTKETGKGTGQGLAIAHSVVVGKHKGTITFDTEMEKGTTFIIRLPLSLPTSGKDE